MQHHFSQFLISPVIRAEPAQVNCSVCPSVQSSMKRASAFPLSPHLTYWIWRARWYEGDGLAFLFR